MATNQKARRGFGGMGQECHLVSRQSNAAWASVPGMSLEARRISEAYFDAVRGKTPELAHWVTPIPIGG